MRGGLGGGGWAAVNGLNCVVVVANEGRRKAGRKSPPPNMLLLALLEAVAEELADWGALITALSTPELLELLLSDESKG